MNLINQEFSTLLVDFCLAIHFPQFRNPLIPKREAAFENRALCHHALNLFTNITESSIQCILVLFLQFSFDSFHFWNY